MTNTARHLSITDRVQDVSYRWHMSRQARALGLTGWVRNRHDGSVEAQASGPDAADLCLDFEQRETNRRTTL